MLSMLHSIRLWAIGSTLLPFRLMTLVTQAISTNSILGKWSTRKILEPGNLGAAND
jgi:hypothetical protein